jgi:hypothetical protein
VIVQRAENHRGGRQVDIRSGYFGIWAGITRFIGGINGQLFPADLGFIEHNRKAAIAARGAFTNDGPVRTFDYNGAAWLGFTRQRGAVRGNSQISWCGRRGRVCGAAATVAAGSSIAVTIAVTITSITVTAIITTAVSVAISIAIATSVARIVIGTATTTTAAASGCNANPCGYRDTAQNPGPDSAAVGLPFGNHEAVKIFDLLEMKITGGVLYPPQCAVAVFEHQLVGALRILGVKVVDRQGFACVKLDNHVLARARDRGDIRSLKLKLYHGRGRKGDFCGFDIAGDAGQFRNDRKRTHGYHSIQIKWYYRLCKQGKRRTIKRIPAVNALNGVALVLNFGRTNPLPVKAGIKK